MGNANCLQARPTNIEIEPEVRCRKILLLGCGDSGKTTIYKNMIILRKKGFTLEERLSHRCNILNNVIFGIKALISATKQLEMPLSDSASIKIADKLLHINLDPISEETPWNEVIGNEICQLWKDDNIQAAWKMNGRFQIIENFDYFVGEIPRMNAKDYTPTEKDILMCRSKSLGIIETAFEYNNKLYKLVDVGGQRTERKKWIHCFENVSAVLVVVALSEFNQILYEDNQTSRMKESLELFDGICRGRHFANTPIFLLMNKEDVFSEKINTSDLSDYFPEYQGGKDYDAALNFIINKFMQDKNEDQIKVKVLNATDTTSVEACMESILKSGKLE